MGNALRVATEITTDFTRAAFPVMGISGFFEVTALLLWGMDVWQTMHQPAAASRRLPHAGVQPDSAA